MSAMVLVFVALVLAWLGHACLWTALLNNIYGRPLPKYVLKGWRYATGLVILAFPLLVESGLEVGITRDDWGAVKGEWGRAVLGYVVLCLLIGGVVFPVITIRRSLRPVPASLVHAATRTLDLWPEYGEKLIGDGLLASATRIPCNDAFRVDFDDLVIALPNLPPEWDGLSILILSDLHFHGTPSRDYFELIISELAAAPPPDLVCLLGDFVDTERHHEWIGPLLGRLTATVGKFAILGNHDLHYRPDRIRAELAAAGYTVLGNGWREMAIRGVPCVLVGHEGPWFGPPPDLSAAPSGLFRLGLSHTPDNFYWAIANQIGLLLCGHVHGGAIRIPVVGSIFVPSRFGRRFDMGVFEEAGTVMVVNRGLSGREPIRFRCNPQVMRLTLKARDAERR
jgi:predicted MPP superfamily phosphohydrolase